MESFFTFLEKRVDDVSSLLCVGLDPHISDLESPTAASALKFCLNLINQTSRYASAYKPNAAFFEVFGAEGWNALKEVVSSVKEESYKQGSSIPVVLDAKRGDISSTAEAYAQSAFESLGVDGITLNPYLGKDSIDPFIKNSEKGVFILCKTSNAGSGDIQNLIVTADTRPPTTVNGQPSVVYLYEHVAQLANSWNEKNNVGIVVGATHVEAMKRIREAVPNLWFLTPGVGAQGADLESAMKVGLRKDGKGMLIPVSRAISRANNPAKAAADLRDEMLGYRIK